MIELHNISISYGKRTLLNCVDAVFPGNRLTALIGRNGTGKSTLLRAIAGLKDYKGEVLLCGKPAKTADRHWLAKHVAYVSTERPRVCGLSCYDIVAMGRAPYTNWIGNLTHEDKQIVEHSLKLVGMSGYAWRTMDKMSDGECQRVMIARALAQDTSIILLDEPTSFLDMPNRYQLCSLLSSLAHNEGKCIMLSTHELDIALNMCDYITIIDPPHLHTMSSTDMKASGNIERLFENEAIAFDAENASIIIKR